MIKLFLILIYIQYIYSYQCDKPCDASWWKTATFYQIYPKSFKDTDGDGIGDLHGVIEKLDYIKNLGVTGIWLSPIFKSPEKDQGYDISDYRDINPIFGTLEIFQRLVIEVHKRRLKIIVDFVPNHTSDQHEWFEKSVNREDKYEDYYVWKGDENSTEPPNNWISNFKFSAWEWNEKRKQYYLHQFLKEQPDLNFRNHNVRNEMKDILSYWLVQHNVDGVRIDAVPFLIEEKNFRDEPRSKDPNATEIDYEYLNHIYTLNQPESYELVYEWRAHVERTSAITGQEKICMSEAVQPTDMVVPYYGSADGSKLGAHFSFNFILLLELKSTSNAKELANLINDWLNKLPKRYTSNWVLGSHDVHRVATKLGKERVDLLNMLTGFLPGIQVTYNGEEIGMENGPVPCLFGYDHVYNCTTYPNISRDFERTPMQWDNSKCAGFTNVTRTWLPVSYKKLDCNVFDQEKNAKSHLNIYRDIQKLRALLKQQTQIQLNVLDKNKNILEIIRFNTAKEGDGKTDIFEMILNYGNETVVVRIAEEPPFQIMLRSGNSPKKCGEIIRGKHVTMNPYEAIIFRPTNRLPQK